MKSNPALKFDSGTKNLIVSRFVDLFFRLFDFDFETKFGQSFKKKFVCFSMFSLI